MTVDQTSVAGTACPACGEFSLRLESRLEAKPIGSYSIAGAQSKVAAVETVWLVCGGCGIEAKGTRA